MDQFKSIDLPESNLRERAAASQPKRYAWLWILVALAIVGGIWYYRSSHAPGQAQAAGAPGGPGGPNGGFNPANFVVPVVVATAQTGDLPVYLNGLGTVTAFNTVTVRSRVDGQIVKVNFTEGQFVHEGDSLVEIDPRPYQVQLEQAEGQMAKDQAQLRDAQVDMKRYTTLQKEGVIPQQQVDTQQAQVGQSEGAIKADQASIDNAKLQITYSHITAPISGRIGLRLVDIGNIVHATDTTGLLVITQLQPISVIFSLPQDQLPQVLPKLRAGGPLAVEAYDRDDITKIATGKLVTIDNQIDVTTGTYKLKSIFGNETNILFPNQFVNIHLLVDTKKHLTVVPATALQRGPQGTYMYVVGDGNVAKIRSVTVAQATGPSIGVSAGLNKGDVVVIDGQDKLQEGSKVDPHTLASAVANSLAGATPAASANGGKK